MQDDKDLSSLKALAEKATPGPWDFDTAETPIRIAGGEVVGGDALPYGDVYTMQEYETPDGSEPLIVAQEIGVDNGRFVAAANPQAILSLISRIEQSEAKLAAVARWLEANQPDVFARGLWDAINASATASDSTDAAAGAARQGGNTSAESVCASPARDVGGLTDERVYELVAEHELCTRKLFGQAVFNSVTVLNFARAIEREVLATKAAEPVQAEVHVMKEQAEGWLAVCATLDELRFGWRFHGCNGMVAAVNTIRSLSTSPAPELPVQADLIDLLETAVSQGHTVMWQRKRREVLAALKNQLATSPAPSVKQEQDNALAEMEARKDAAYLERNQVVAALAKCFPSGVARTAIEGWSEDWHGCVYIDLPTGQASWHFHDSHAHLFDGLPPYAGKWDGHTTEEKYARLANLAAPSVKQEAGVKQPCGGREYCGRFPFCGCGDEPLFPERDPSKPAEQQGLFRKFEVRRVDGSDQPGGKHYGCRYYVLDLNHDQHAPAAMRAYAASCRTTHPQLAADIETEFGTAPTASQGEVKVPEGWRELLAEAATMFESAARWSAGQGLWEAEANEEAMAKKIRSALSAAPSVTDGEEK